MPPRLRFASIDEYVAASDPGVQEILATIRKRVAAAIPDAAECIGYQMPAFRRKKVFFYFAAFKKHIGVYPPLHDPALDAELVRYRGPKGNLQFPLSEPMPFELIARVARSLATQYGDART
ncbi:iron chaperone [Ramlibacter sp.]|uniref:iron chaperone n=1 Tax=Ramlibacter sp. TaxID=1917967 RepID=UPI003D111D2A